MLQVYKALTNMVEQPAAGDGSQQGVCFRRLAPHEPPCGSCSVLVMDYCEKGTLRQAVQRCMFHRKLGPSSVAVDVVTITEVRLVRQCGQPQQGPCRCTRRPGCPCLGDMCSQPDRCGC